MMQKELDLIQNYISKHPIIEDCDNRPPQASTKWCVVVPVYREEEYLNNMLESFLSVKKPKAKGELILVFNSSENDDDEVVNQQKRTLQSVKNKFGNTPNDWITLLYVEAFGLSKKHFGAGWARKIGMDLATKRFAEIENPLGVIITLDADCKVADNYLVEIEKWADDETNQAASIYFEHPISGNDFSGDIYDGIIKYELHLRYYLQALKLIGYPYAFHTMGSAIAVRALDYARVGGMPRKQAGEDFYFLQKVMPLSGFGEINTTAVYPSPRPSDRVIFGTGAAITGHLEGTNQADQTYNYVSFKELKVLFDRYSELYEMSPDKYEEWTYELAGPLRSFLLNNNFFQEIDDLKQVCSKQEIFNKRFFEIFNPFKIVKYLNYLVEHFYAKVPVFDAANQLLEDLGKADENAFLEEELLMIYRRLEKSNG